MPDDAYAPVRERVDAILSLGLGTPAWLGYGLRLDGGYPSVGLEGDLWVWEAYEGGALSWRSTSRDPEDVVHWVVSFVVNEWAVQRGRDARWFLMVAPPELGRWTMQMRHDWLLRLDAGIAARWREEHAADMAREGLWLGADDGPLAAAHLRVAELTARIDAPREATIPWVRTANGAHPTIAIEGGEWVWVAYDDHRAVMRETFASADDAVYRALLHVVAVTIDGEERGRRGTLDPAARAARECALLDAMDPDLGARRRTELRA